VSDQSKHARSTDPRINAALREYLERVDRGEALDAEEFLAQHPEIVGELRSFIAAEDQLRKLAAAEPARGTVDRSTHSFARHGLETIAPQAGTKRSADSDTGGLTGQFGRYRIVKALGKRLIAAATFLNDSRPCSRSPKPYSAKIVWQSGARKRVRKQVWLSGAWQSVT
jgi:hypothetical protein